MGLRKLEGYGIRNKVANIVFVFQVWPVGVTTAAEISPPVQLVVSEKCNSVPVKHSTTRSMVPFLLLALDNIQGFCDELLTMSIRLKGEQNPNSKLREPSPTKICHTRSRSTGYESVLQEQPHGVIPLLN